MNSNNIAIIKKEEREAIEKQIEVIFRHQEQQRAYFDAMEGIRWKFVTAFGLGAAVALFVSSGKVTNSISEPLTVLTASIFVIVLSLASLVTQVRIYGLMISAWQRIRWLQIQEAELAQKLYGFGNDIKESFVFPGTVGVESPTYHPMSVHMATCFAFACFIGISVNSIIRIIGVNLYFLDFVVSTIFVISGVWLATSRYVSTLLLKSEMKNT